MSAMQRVAAIVVAILVVAAIAVMVLVATGAPIGLGPEASASAEPEPSPASRPSSAPSVSAPPSVPDDADVLAALAEIEEQVIAIRGLPAADIGPAELITRDELADELQVLFDEQYPPEERERDNLALRALGLLEADQDVATLQLQLLGDQVLGFYDDIEKRMVVVTDAGLDPAARLTYAHEYTHALQDAAFGLDSLEIDAVGEDDRGLARTAMIEGDATVTMLAWALEHLTQQELLEIGTTTEIPDTTGIPSWMVNQLQFPYTAGQLWAGTLTRDPLSPDFAEVDEAYGDPPETTEQIIDLDAWYAREPPAPIDAFDLVGLLGEEWDEVDATPIGQASIDIVLQHFGVTQSLSRAAADGWGGDRAVIASGPDGTFAVAWHLAWDSAADADEFGDAYATVVEALPFPAVVRAIGDDEILVVHASDEDLLKQVADAAD
jgi:hypothetical protein